jgi:cytosine deaminase
MIVAIEPNLTTGGPVIDAGGRLVSPGFVESHIHLDKSCILDRCTSTRGDLEEAIDEAAKAKAAFTPEDVRVRATSTLEACAAQPVHSVRRLFAHPDGEPLCEYLSGRQEGRHAGML